MKMGADTSFLCALYRLQANSPGAAAHFAAMPGPLEVSSLLLYEFRQSVRFQTRLHRLDRTKGYAKAEGSKMLAGPATGAVTIQAVPWSSPSHRRAPFQASHGGEGPSGHGYPPRGDRLGTRGRRNS